MNKEELTKKIMRGLKNSLNESALPEVSADDNEIYDEADGHTIAKIWDDGTVKFKNDLSQEEKALYKASILNNRRLCNWFNIREDSFINESLNESKTFDPRNNKDHKAAYNSFVKWFDRWKGKLDRDELRAMIKKVSADALGDNLDIINESHMPGADDDHQAFDLFLWFENTQELWEPYGEWTAKCILKRLRREQPVLEEYLAKSSVVEKAAIATIKSYNKEFPGTYVSSATRKNLREKIAHRIYEYAMDEWEYEKDND